jgi:hypothetical protein
MTPTEACLAWMQEVGSLPCAQPEPPGFDANVLCAALNVEAGDSDPLAFYGCLSDKSACFPGTDAPPGGALNVDGIGLQTGTLSELLFSGFEFETCLTPPVEDEGPLVVEANLCENPLEAQLAGATWAITESDPLRNFPGESPDHQINIWGEGENRTSLVDEALTFAEVTLGGQVCSLASPGSGALQPEQVRFVSLDQPPGIFQISLDFDGDPTCHLAFNGDVVECRMSEPYFTRPGPFEAGPGVQYRLKLSGNGALLGMGVPIETFATFDTLYVTIMADGS